MWENRIAEHTRAVPAAELPVVAPVQYRPPTRKRITTTDVSHVVIMVRRPSLSAVRDQSKTASRLQQLIKGRELVDVRLAAGVWLTRG